MSILVLTEQEIRQTVSMAKAMEAIEEAFAALARSKARLPDVIVIVWNTHARSLSQSTVSI